MKSKFIFSVVVASVVYACYVDGQSTCKNGTCVSVFDCSEMLDLMNKKNLTQQEVDLLKKSQCGFQRTTPMVCCPEQCYNPDAKPGKCVNIYECPHLATMLKPPLSRPDNLVYVQNSICTGPDRYSVCCGPERKILADRNTKCTGIINALLPDPNVGCCGSDAKSSNKITGGEKAGIDQYPWLALIEYRKDGGPIKTMCGGTLISGRYVLTAAHCVTGAILSFGTPKSVRLGEYDTSTSGKDCVKVEAGGSDCNSGAISIPIEESIPHPDYNTRTKQSKQDIALIRLKQSAPFTYFIRPICLPATDLTLNPPENFTLFAAGWGAVSESELFSSVKLYVDLPFLRSDVCQTAYRAPGRNIDLWKGQMCAGGQPGKDSCRGDSGGPLMYENLNNKGTYEVLGVISFGPTPCGLPNIPGVYTKVFEYIPWIKSQMRA